MTKYSITLNFFIPQELVRKLKKVKVSGNVGNVNFDWRDSKLCHCTLKAIYVGDKISKKIAEWSKKCEEILSKQKSFKVEIKDIAQFPNTIFTNVYSKEMLNLHNKLCEVLPSSQPQYEHKKFTPHVSLVIISKDAQILSNQKQSFGNFDVKEIQLMVWDLENLNKSIVYKKFHLIK